MTNPVSEFKAKYIGGHSKITKKRKVTLRLTKRDLVIPEMELSIEYGAIRYVNMVKQAALRKRGLFEYIDYIGIILMTLAYVGLWVYSSRKKCLQISYSDEKGLEELLNFEVKDLENVHAIILNHVVSGKQEQAPPVKPPARVEKKKSPAPTILVSNKNRAQSPLAKASAPTQSVPSPQQAAKKTIQGLEVSKSYTIGEINEHLSKLEQLLEAGEISKNEYARMSQPVFTDLDGKKWRAGKDTGRWYFFDGAKWRFGDPPSTLTRS